MRGIVYSSNDIEGIKFVDTLQKPLVKDNHCLVRVKANSVNPVDAKYCVGDKLPNWLARSIGKWFMNDKIVGFDFSGIIEDLGSQNDQESQQFKIGDHIFGAMLPLTGSFSEYIVVPYSNIVKFDNDKFAEMASLPLVGLTCIQALKYEHGLQQGQNILIIGASGGVGSCAVMVAKAIVGNSGKVFAICSERNHNYVKELGADFILDYTQGIDLLIQQLKDLVKVQVNNEKFDLVFDCVSSLEEIDKQYRYNEAIMSNGLIKKKINRNDPSIHRQPSSNYICIGGSTQDWCRALYNRFTNFNIQSENYELFWIRFENCRDNGLKILKQMVDDKKILPEKLIMNQNKIKVDYYKNIDAIRGTFKQLHSRRVVGKIVYIIDQD